MNVYPLYTPHPHHRSKSHASLKSQWSIDISDEIQTFLQASAEGLLFSCVGWGLFEKEGSVQYVGSAPDSTNLIFAKFVDSSRNGHWHGYPGDQRRFQDRPPRAVQRKWLNLLHPGKVRKLLKGQKCTL